MEVLSWPTLMKRYPSSTTMEEDHPYIVTSFKRAKSKFGPKIFAILDEKIPILLPDHISRCLMIEDYLFNKMISAANQLKLNLTYKADKRFVVYPYKEEIFWGIVNDEDLFNEMLPSTKRVGLNFKMTVHHS